MLVSEIPALREFWYPVVYWAELTRRCSSARSTWCGAPPMAPCTLAPTCARIAAPTVRRATTASTASRRCAWPL